MTEPSLVSPRMLIGWIAAAALTVLLSVAFMLHSEGTATVGPSTFSRSAIGHAGIADILQRRGLTVLKSRGDSLHKVGAGGVLVVAEPEFRLPADRGQQALLHARTVLLVLPKWQGQPDRRESGWIAEAKALPMFVPQSVLDAALGHGEVVRPAGPLTLNHNEIGLVPHLTDPVQLVTSDRLRPIVGGEDGMLLGELRDGGRRLWVLSDPDVISNHGMGDGNATFAVAMFDALRHGQTIVFDETVHGFAAVPANPAALLLRQPFAGIGIQALAALALLMWAAAARFGAPETAPPPLKAGKRDLVRNVAGLFRFAGYQHVLVRRYVEETIRDVARHLHTPRDLPEAASLGWLQRLAAARGVSADCAGISTRAAVLAATGRRASAEQTRLPREIWRWKQEMMHGVAGSPGDRGGYPRGGPQGRGGPG
ncbi:MAG TPA: DUF4350 domain-containing protein [Acetobacteraceae bacterium]|nr:DUF4350 domain-containing protein [Acetobacteraceae bacterium]